MLWGLVGLSLLLAWAGQARADTFSLAGDWSDAVNPNGVWSYNDTTSNGAIVPNTIHQDNWDPSGGFGGFTGSQPAWAYQVVGNPGHIPAWCLSVGNTMFDLPAGRVFVHTADSANGYHGDTIANVTWTSPGDGIIAISGGTWLGRKTLGRSDDWSLQLNGTVLTAGSLSSSDSYTSNNPFLFQDGSGGPDVLMQIVAAGDVVIFTAVRTSFYGEAVAVDLTIDFTPF